MNFVNLEMSTILFGRGRVILLLELSCLLGRSSCCSFVIVVNVIHKFVFEDLKRTSYFVIAVLIACVRYLKMARSRQIGGKKAGKKR